MSNNGCYFRHIYYIQTLQLKESTRSIMDIQCNNFELLNDYSMVYLEIFYFQIWYELISYQTEEMMWSTSHNFINKLSIFKLSLLSNRLPRARESP